MKKLIILLFSIFISINSYGGIFSETVCFETSGQNIVFLPIDSYPYSGKYICKYDNGQKKSEGKIKDGIQVGKWTEWWGNGQLKSERNYKDGKLDGKWTNWYENTQKKSEENYKDGKLDGKWTRWDENGQIELEATFKDGKCISGDC